MKESRRGSLKRREAIEGWLFASPWIAGFLIFTIGPIIASFILSFCDYSVYSAAKWIGIENYRKMFFEDSLYWTSLYNTVYYLISVPLGMTVALGCALLLNRQLIGKNVLRTMYYLPSVTSGVAISLLWMWIFDPNLGFFNDLLKRVGINGPLWLQSEKWSKPAIILMSFWGIGGTMVLYLAALQGVPEQLYEAAELDGANSWQKFWHVTIPMLSPTILFTLVMGIIGSFQVFTQAYVMTNGGPLNSTLFYVLYLYRNGFVWLHLGYASAMAWVLFIIILVITLLIFRSSPAWVYYEAKRGKWI
jgi:multiple sugar transport system permease protein